MDIPDSQPAEAFWQEDPFGFIKPKEFEALGIDPSDIAPGTYPAQKHPSLLQSRFGGNAYGFGFFEISNRLDPESLNFLQSISLSDPEEISKHYKEINTIFKDIGILIRFSNQGHPYYLIPIHLVSNSLSYVKTKAAEISKIVEFHRTKFLKESHKIGLLSHTDELLLNDLSIRFKQHEFILIDSLEKLRVMDETLDLVILTRDIYEIILMEKFVPSPRGVRSIGQLEKYAVYLLGKVYRALKPAGEIFIIAHRHARKTKQDATIKFKTIQEEKNFVLFSHIFKTRKRCNPQKRSFQVNIFDFQKYLKGLYVEQEVMDRLLGDTDLKTMTLEEIHQLPYLKFPLDGELAYDQEKVWPKVLSIYFNGIFLKPLIPDSVKAEWAKKFSIQGHAPDYMFIYLGQKKTPETTAAELKEDILESRLSGCPLPLVAEYRDSMEFLTQTLHVLGRIKSGNYAGPPQIFMERLSQPLVNKNIRYSAMDNVQRLLSKISRLEKIKAYLNPDKIEGPETKVLKNLEMLSFFGFSRGELKEIFLIVVGHTAMGRILSGKMNERALKPVSDMARSWTQLDALNLLRYCRLMSMAEATASRKSDFNPEQLFELFDLYDSMVRVVTGREMDWDQLLDEKIRSVGGIHNQTIRKTLKMMNHSQFIDTWSELRYKGQMEKESLADYDGEKLARIENTIKLVKAFEEFEHKFLKDDPFQFPIFCRKFLNMEFHGTGHLFERMDSRLAFILLWITVNLARSEVINFNPILADVAPEDLQDRIRKVEEDARAININYLDLGNLKQLSDHLYQNRTSFILGTGFQLRVTESTRYIDVKYIDMDENIRKFEKLTNRIVGRRVSEIPREDLQELEKLFSNLESFYRSHLRLLSRDDSGLRFPPRQKEWMKKAQGLRERLRSSFMEVIFQPESLYTDLNLLYLHARSILQFVLPEFLALEDLKLPGRIYLKAPLIDHNFNTAKKFQALIRGDRKNFQNVQLLHQMAQREFGPMVAGIVGLNESQLKTLETLAVDISKNVPLYDAMIKCFIFRDLGLIPALKEKYRDQFHPADHARAGALFLEREEIPRRYNMDEEAGNYLTSLVKYHDLIHHIVRGEFTLYALRMVVDIKDKDLFDAFFLSSFIMFSAMREDLIVEDLAARLFRLRDLCHRIMDGETTLEEHLSRDYAWKGHLHYALEAYEVTGLPTNTSPAKYFESWERDEKEKEKYIRAGRRIASLERIFRLKGIRYVEFPDLANFLIEVPLKFIYEKKKYYGIGYATFEKELFEALRIYRELKKSPEMTRSFILERLVADGVRIFGFENVIAFLNYENMIKLLVIALSASQKFKGSDRTVCLNFLDLAEKIEKRYEAVNDALSNFSMEQLWGGKYHLNHFLKAKNGIVIKKNETHRVITVDFIDSFSIDGKIAHMEDLTDVEQLKNYYHSILQALRKTPFFTEDYEMKLETAFDKRLKEVADQLLGEAKRRMEQLKDFRETHDLFSDLRGRSLDIGFTDDQKHRLNDLYELRNDQLGREKLKEITDNLGSMADIDELTDYWEEIKRYLMDNRPFLGKDLESLIAKKFDEAMERIEEAH